uniref:CCHC-type domain-containing protein n=1 Tax=Octopus bimaculoides TaxID=37653 RepID=A0A0L8HYM5_OCTBM
MLEGRSPKCYGCGERGHLRRKCPRGAVEMVEESTQEDIVVENKQKQKIEYDGNVAEVKSRKRERRKSPTTVDLKKSKGMEEETQPTTRSEENLPVEVPAKESKGHSDQKQDNPELRKPKNIDTEKKHVELQSNEHTDTQIQEHTKQQVNRNKKRQHEKHKQKENYSEMGHPNVKDCKSERHCEREKR